MIPIAGDQVTNDIAVSLRTPTHHAEEIKMKFACALSQLANSDETIEVPRAKFKTLNDVFETALAQEQSVSKQIDALYDQGAEGKAVFAITHPVLLPTALRRLDEDDRIEKLVVTNTIPISDGAHTCKKIRQLSVAPLIAETIQRIAAELHVAPEQVEACDERVEGFVERVGMYLSEGYPEVLPIPVLPPLSLRVIPAGGAAST